jgi:phosphate transport system substrate-binding protein
MWGQCFSWRMLAALAGCTVFLSTSAFSSDVMLKYKAGGLTISGKLLDFDGMDYVVQNEALGVVRVKAGAFNCLGTGCPTGAAPARAPAVSDAETIRISGSSTIGARLMPQLIRDYASTIGAFVAPGAAESDSGDLAMPLAMGGQTVINFELARSGTASVFADLAAGKAAIGMSSRPANERDLSTLAAAGLARMNERSREHIIGLDGIAVLVSPQNKVTALSRDELAGIFSGEIRDWSEVGGDDGPIDVYARDEASGTFETFDAVILKPGGRRLLAEAKPSASDADLAAKIAGDPNGIGFASFAQKQLARPVAIRDSCGLTHAPSEFGVKAREYPLARNLYLYTGRSANEHVAGLVDFALSPAADIRLEELGFLDRSISSAPYEDFHDLVAHALEAAPNDFDIDLMRQLQKDLGAGKRLSVMVRFEKRSEHPDDESLAALGRVAAHLGQQTLDGRKLVVAGFSDTSGQFDRNRDLSYKRAAGVRDLLVPSLSGMMKPEDIEVRGYGELMPVACNDSEAGREKNRRVEIWLVPTERARPVVLIKQL